MRTRDDTSMPRLYRCCCAKTTTLSADHLVRSFVREKEGREPIDGNATPGFAFAFAFAFAFVGARGMTRRIRSVPFQSSRSIEQNLNT
jgi:hypothetical protein